MATVKSYEVPVLMPEDAPQPKPSISKIRLSCLAISAWSIKCKIILSTALLVATVGAGVFALYIVPCNIPAPPGTCQPLLSFAKEIPSAQRDMDPFAYIVASDSQFPWVDERQATIALCESVAKIVDDFDRCKEWFAKHSNELQLRAARHLMHGTRNLTWPTATGLTIQAGERIVPPVQLVMNGDLTAFYHEDEAESYEQMFHAKDVNMMPGLGNHDYTNNANDCFRLSFDANCCAKRAVDYMRQGVACGTIPNFDSARITSYDAPSMAYSWDEGNYHFVQLHYRPYYEDPELPVESSIDWLEQDLTEAHARGRSTVIFAHFVIERVLFSSVLEGKGVVGVFHGHIHSFSGFIESYGDVPVFYSGSSSFNTFLVAEFRNNSFNVAAIDAVTGEPVFEDATNSRKMMTVEF